MRISNVVPTVLFALALSPCALAQEMSGVISTEATEAIVTVVDVDRDARTVTVRGPRGKTMTIEVPEQAQNLDQVHPGARFKMQYLNSVVLGLTRGSGIASSDETTTVQLARKGDTPGGSVVHVHVINAVVEEVDRDARTLTVRGPQGGLVELKVGEDVQAYDYVEIGDTVTLRYSEGLAMRMIEQ
jgi:hypothetical protein